MENGTVVIVIETLTDKIEELKEQIYLKDMELNRLRSDNKELTRQRDALAREVGNGKLR